MVFAFRNCDNGSIVHLFFPHDRTIRTGTGFWNRDLLEVGIKEFSKRPLLGYRFESTESIRNTCAQSDIVVSIYALTVHTVIILDIIRSSGVSACCFAYRYIPRPFVYRSMHLYFSCRLLHRFCSFSSRHSCIRYCSILILYGTNDGKKVNNIHENISASHFGVVFSFAACIVWNWKRLVYRPS